MVTTGIQNLPEPLARAEAAYRDPAAQLASASRDRLAGGVGHFASPVQFVLDEPDSTRRLHDLTMDLRTVPRLSALLPQVLRGAMALVGGDFGNMQILDPATGSLRLLRVLRRRRRWPFGLRAGGQAMRADGEAVARHLGQPSGEDPADPVGRAMVSALLDPARVREADVSVPFELWVMSGMTASFARQAGRRGPSRNGPRAEPI